MGVHPVVLSCFLNCGFSCLNYGLISVQGSDGELQFVETINTKLSACLPDSVQIVAVNRLGSTFLVLELASKSFATQPRRSLLFLLSSLAARGNHIYNTAACILPI